MSDDLLIFCKMCKKYKQHMDLELTGNCRWKCKSCGEYNQPFVSEYDPKEVEEK